MSFFWVQLTGEFTGEDFPEDAFAGFLIRPRTRLTLLFSQELLDLSTLRPWRFLFSLPELLSGEAAPQTGEV
jgi:hypothetical protein